MNPHGPHPSLEDLLRWREGELAAAPAKAVQEHVDACAQCAGESSLLDEIVLARRTSRWTSPPARLREKVRRFPGAVDTPAAPLSSQGLQWSPPDVRGGGLGGATENRVVSQVFPHAEVGIVAVPPRGDGSWRIEGRVWLEQNDERPIQLLLVHDDHVIARSRTHDGDFFSFDEVVGPGWVLEVHLPRGEVLTLEDPLS
jgi:hypothetical protein